MKNSSIKKAVATIISATLIIVATASANAEVTEYQPVKAVLSYEYTDTYQAYLDGEVEVDESSGVKLAPFEVSGTSLQPSGSLPSAYQTETTEVKNQGAFNTCWAFASIGALEAFLSIDGKGQNDLSEQHLAWWSTDAYGQGIGWLNSSLDTGGYSMIGAGYMASWQGPKTEEDVPYSSSKSKNVIPDNMDTVPNAYNVTGIMYVENDITSVKTAIYEYGAVATSFNSGKGYNSDRSAYYQSNDTMFFSGHAVTIIGWDDNYSRENFSESDRPEADGAWLVKNSWGKSTGDNGYMWISYYDRYVLDTLTWGPNIAYTSARTATDYDRLYQAEEYGSTYFTYLVNDSGNTVRTVTFANVFDFDDVHSKLEKVIFECENEGAKYTVYYIPIEDGKPVYDKAQWSKLASGTINTSGYICVDTAGYELPAGLGAIGVTIQGNDTSKYDYASIGVDEWLVNTEGKYIFMPDQKWGTSFVINGKKVYDLMEIYETNDDTIGGNLVIKAVTTTNIIGDVNDDGRSTTADALLVLRQAIGLTKLTDEQLVNADTNFDGKVTALDSYYIQKQSIGLMSDY